MTDTPDGASSTERAGVHRSQQSRSITPVEYGCIPPTLIGPGDDTGDLQVNNPVLLRWNPVAGASHYRVTYSLESGTGKDQELGTTTQTQFSATFPLGKIKWKIYSVFPDGCDANSTNLKFTVVSGSGCTAPAITQQPASTEIQSGQTATLTAAASGTSPLSYQWMQGSQVVGTGTTFTTPALTSTTTYTVRVSNSCGSATSQPAVVTVCSPASITKQPASTEITSGQTATLSVTATGTQPISYRWLQGSTVVGSGATFTTPALTQTTTYRVEVSNACGTVMSQPAVVTVCMPPSITQQPASPEILSGQTATLSVTAAGTQPIGYKWLQGSQVVGSGASFTTPALTQTTTYTVEVSNACGTVTSQPAVVTVRQQCTPPSITQQPASPEILSGQTATLSVTAAGTQPIDYKWLQGSQVVGSGASFTTPALTQTTTYTVEVSNACGTVTSQPAVVTVKEENCISAAIAQQPASTEVTSGQSATLTVKATGTEPIAYQWYEGSQLVGTGATFLTPALTQTTSYSVKVSNACGTATSAPATVTVKSECAVPRIDAPHQFTIDEGSSATIDIAVGGTQPISIVWMQGGSTLQFGGTRFVTPAINHSTAYQVEATNACGTDRATIVVHVRPSAACGGELAPPVAMAVADAHSHVAYEIRWQHAGAERYEVDESDSPNFQNVTTVSTTEPFARFVHGVSVPTAFYYRVRAMRGCDDARGPDSAVVAVVVLPMPSRQASQIDLIAPYGTQSDVTTTIELDLGNARTFAVTSAHPWLTVRPESGAVPAHGIVTLTLSVSPIALSNGTSMTSLTVVTDAAGKSATTDASTTKNVTVSISLVTPVSPVTQKPSQGSEALIIPAVAHADGNNSRWQSDVRIAHTYGLPVRYQLIFTPSGGDASKALATEIRVGSGETIALDDILGRWFAAGALGGGATGALEIRALDAMGAGRTLASSRLFNATANGSFGQFVPAVPLASFLRNGNRQSLMSLAQSRSYRTNLGIVEASGNAAEVILEVFDGAGRPLFEEMLSLKAGEHRQIGAIFAAKGIDTSNARIDVRLASPLGRVYGYASVVDNQTGDPSFVPPVDAGAGAREVTIAGVADLVTVTGRWQTDLRLFNGGFATQTAQIAFYKQGESAPAATRAIELAPGEVRALDNLLQSLFDITGAGGALRITAQNAGSLVAAARTYHQRAEGTYGQYIPGATADEAARLGGPAVHVLQVEESPRFRTNIGLAEVMGKETAIEVTVTVPGSRVSARAEMTLAPNEFRQLGSILRSLGYTEAYNANVAVRVVGGEGRVLAYGSVIDMRTSDPTYVAAQ